MGIDLSRFNPFQAANEDSVDLPRLPEKSFREFVEEKFLELITEAQRLDLIHIGRGNVMDAIENGIRGLVFFAGESTYSVSQMCIENRILYYVFASGNDVCNIIKTGRTVVMVENHCSYYGLYDLCKTALEILNDQ